MTNLKGSDYQRTWGKLINYNRLAHFLVKLLRIFNSSGEVENFVDLACGTGDLLSEVGKITPKYKLIGIDNDSIQLNIAEKQNQNILFLNQDIFKLTNTSLHTLSNYSVFHLGFCFINTLTKESLCTIFSAFAQISNAKILIIETLNADHQKKNFVFDKQFTTKVSDELTIRTMSKQIDKKTGKFKLTLKFIEQSSNLSETITLFLHKRELLTTVAKNAGWIYASFLPATYRTRQGNSHDIIVFSKKKMKSIIVDTSQN